MLTAGRPQGGSGIVGCGRSNITPPHHTSTAYHTMASLQHITLWHHSSISHCGITPAYHTMASLQHITLWHHSSISHYCITPAYHTMASLQHNTTPLAPSISLPNRLSPWALSPGPPPPLPPPPPNRSHPWALSPWCLSKSRVDRSGLGGSRPISGASTPASARLFAACVYACGWVQAIEHVHLCASVCLQLCVCVRACVCVCVCVCACMCACE